jgi:hypothetical protein
MEKTMSMHRVAILGFLLAFAGCASQPDGLVLGAWHGQQPGPDRLVPTSVDLVLEGAPNAQSGTYRIATVVHDPSARSFLDDHRWSGAWERTKRVVNGQTLTIIDLHNALSSDISHYALMPDGTLHALDPNGTIGKSALAASFVLAPDPVKAPRGLA